MNFKNILNDKIKHINENITIDSFLLKVNNYNNIDDALGDLPDEYLEFYAKNSKKLEISLQRLKLKSSDDFSDFSDFSEFNETSSEDPGYTGWSRENDEKTKTIKYKGELIHLVWSPTTRTWTPFLGFRGITSALKHAKKMVNFDLAK